MLTAIEEERLYWDCLVFDEDGMLTSCGRTLAAHVEEAEYRHVAQRGDVIALPVCSCGARTFLKADYRLKDLWKNTLTVKNNAGVTWAYVLRYEHMRNLWAHWLLYERGLAPTAPLLSLPPPRTVIGNLEMTHALWFGFATVRAYLTAIGAESMVALLPQAPVLLEREA